jgi:hypothetical protein
VSRRWGRYRSCHGISVGSPLTLAADLGVLLLAVATTSSILHRATLLSVKDFEDSQQSLSYSHSVSGRKDCHSTSLIALRPDKLVEPAYPYPLGCTVVPCEICLAGLTCAYSIPSSGCSRCTSFCRLTFTFYRPRHLLEEVLAYNSISVFLRF